MTQDKTATKQTRITIDLEELLRPEELEEFMQRAREAGHTPEEHFLAITLGNKEAAA